MAEMLNNLDAPSDAELISRVRGGDVDAYGLLFSRHVEAARRLARQLVRGPDADDLVSDAFTKVMGVLQRGGGPDLAFRAYLLTAVRRLHVDRIRAQSRLTTSEDLSEFDPGVPFQDTVVEQFESGAAARAFASLPERWQMVLWHLEVEQQKPAEIAPLLGMTANSVSALAYRAREGLRQAFLSAHLAETTDADCCWAVDHMGGYVRNGLSRRDSDKMAAHLEGCRTCTAMHLELVEVNTDLSGVLAPLLLGGLAAGYLGAVGSGVGVGGVLALVDRAKDFVVANLVPVAAGTTAAGLATAVVVAGGPGFGGRQHEPIASTSPVPGQTSGAESAVFTEQAEGTGKGSGNGSGKDGDGSAKKSGGPGPGTKTGKPDDRPSPSATPSNGASADHPGPPTAPPGSAPTAPPAAPPASPPGSGAATTPPPAQSPGQPSPTPKDPPSQTPAKGQDIALRVDGSVVAKSIGRFRTHVTGLPTSSGPTPLHFDISFDKPEVHLDTVPGECTMQGGSSVSCSGGSGASWNGVFDADLSALDNKETVVITVTVSIPGDTDPDPGDNTSSVTLTRSGTARFLGVG